MKLENKNIGVLAENMYEDLELWVPVHRLREEGARVQVIGTGSAKRYESKHGYPVTPDTEASQVSASSLDGLVIPGGYAPDFLRRHAEVTNLVRACVEEGKVVAAICHGPWVLVSAGVLRGRTITCFHAIKDDVVNAGAEYVDREVVVDRNLITSRKPDDLPAFCRELVKALAGA